jgi:hypothetical protein
MALMLPLLLLVLFGIIDMGYYIYGYSTIYFAARNGTEVAAELPPNTAQLGNSGDPCTAAIFGATEDSVGILPNFNTNKITISYPSGKRALGEPIEVRVQYDVQPLTPLFRLVRIGNAQGALTVNIAARRSIEGLGNGPITAKNPSGIVCS